MTATGRPATARPASRSTETSPQSAVASRARRLGDVHLVDRYDHTQLALLARLHRLDQAATPLVVPRAPTASTGQNLHTTNAARAAG